MQDPQLSAYMQLMDEVCEAGADHPGVSLNPGSVLNGRNGSYAAPE